MPFPERRVQTDYFNRMIMLRLTNPWAAITNTELLAHYATRELDMHRPTELHPYRGAHPTTRPRSRPHSAPQAHATLAPSRVAHIARLSTPRTPSKGAAAAEMASLKTVGLTHPPSAERIAVLSQPRRPRCVEEPVRTLHGPPRAMDPVVFERLTRPVRVRVAVKAVKARSGSARRDGAGRAGSAGRSGSAGRGGSAGRLAEEKGAKDAEEEDGASAHGEEKEENTEVRMAVDRELSIDATVVAGPRAPAAAEPEPANEVVNPRAQTATPPPPPPPAAVPERPLDVEEFERPLTQLELFELATRASLPPSSHASYADLADTADVPVAFTDPTHSGPDIIELARRAPLPASMADLGPAAIRSSETEMSDSSSRRGSVPTPADPQAMMMRTELRTALPPTVRASQTLATSRDSSSQPPSAAASQQNIAAAPAHPTTTTTFEAPRRSSTTSQKTITPAAAAPTKTASQIFTEAVRRRLPATEPGSMVDLTRASSRASISASHPHRATAPSPPSHPSSRRSSARSARQKSTPEPAPPPPKNGNKNASSSSSSRRSSLRKAASQTVDYASLRLLARGGEAADSTMSLLNRAVWAPLPATAVASRDSVAGTSSARESVARRQRGDDVGSRASLARRVVAQEPSARSSVASSARKKTADRLDQEPPLPVGPLGI
ncbi:hypothetical protein BDK51DRAFT_50450 [Blyttiomyces helicus]|uniref:Uncharacterized protein n=1 Tax=Blyttiomyces helicus TaxID=388810 RepID=A0A4P9W015_9FUNG|nr:hypothetical protein BDK51DRAFT_50450 [Blyttiomyces helicus]|eukprot:RKO85394.1 hypothetical protein BDK51DRAFT_50450 [Blyttiomyces helicus]